MHALIFVYQNFGWSFYYKPASFTNGPGTFGFKKALREGKIINQLDLDIFFHDESIFSFRRGNSYPDWGQKLNYILNGYGKMMKIYHYKL